MGSDIIWALVAVYAVGVAAWLIFHIGRDARVRALELKNEESLMQHDKRITLVEKGFIGTQKELVTTRDAVTRIENRLAPNPTPRPGTRSWPGES